MIKTWLLISLLALGCSVGLMGAIIEFSDYRAFQTNGKEVKAVPALKVQATGQAVGQDTLEVLLKFKTDAGVDVFVSRNVPKRLLERLSSDGYIELIYLADDPKRTIFKGEILPKGYFWLGFAVISGLLFVVALRSRYRIAGFLTGIPSGDFAR